MKTAVNRLRGVERDIVQAPQVGDVAPYYEPQANEIAIFEAAYKKRLPVMLKGPTGCGKTRFLEHMAFQLKRPLVTVSCHEELTSEKKGQEIDAHEDFILVISYNPGYQTVLKDLKPSTKQRFIGINFDFPAEDIERKIVMKEAAGISQELVHQLVAAGRKA